MIPVTIRKGQKIAVFGLGGSGMVTAEALMAGGADVCAHDDNPARVADAKEQGISVSDLHEYDFSSCDALVLSPGVPLTHPEPHWSVKLASKAGVPVIGDVQLFCEERRQHGPDSRLIAITGTNGKSSTTALVAHIFATAGETVEMGGNIGKAVLSLSPNWDKGVFVVECSSYQIDLAPELDPLIGIHLNLAPDHLDRHGTMERYAAIKKRLVAGSRHAIVGIDDEDSASIADDLERSGQETHRISCLREVANGAYAEGSVLYSAEAGVSRQVIDLAGIPTLQGRHNAQNACAAYVACRLGGLSDVDIVAGLRSFHGLEHRMEVLGQVGDILFVNDSKATNADAAAMALGSFSNIYWIAGGLEKEGGIESLEPLFGNVEKAYLVGEAASTFASVFGGDTRFEISGTIDQAVQNAFRDAKKAGKADAVVLLSPACASFDQFQNFEKRGEFFRKCVTAIEGFTSYGEIEK